MAVSVFGPVRAAQSWDLQARYTGFSGWPLAVASPLGGVLFGVRPLLVQVTRIAIARATT
jgi:hypothetical protein